MIVRAAGRRGPGPLGRPPTRSTAPTPGCVPSCEATGSATSWRSAATAASPPTPARSAPTSWPPALPRRAWHRLSAGPGAKGHRFYDWAWIDHTDRAHRDDPLDTQRWWLLIRRHRDTGELAFYRCYSPDAGAAARLVRVAGRRWTVEEAFQAGKGLAGLDQHQVRRWISWHRWTMLAMLAHALLAVLAAADTPTDPDPTGLIALTCNEIRRLFTVLDHRTRPRSRPARWHWSTWRRRHQHRARPATTSARKPNINTDNDLRLEY